MGPVAAKLLKELRRARTRTVVDLGAFRDARNSIEAPVPRESDGIPKDHAAWLETFKVLTTIGNMLLGTPSLRKLALRIEAADQQYMPGGPPSSPVLDSVFVTWWMTDVGVGPRRETLASMIAEIGPMLGLPPVLCERARILAHSRMGVYRVRETGKHRVQLDELPAGPSVAAALPADLVSRSELWLTRLLPPLAPGSSDWVVWTTPYHLLAQDAEARWGAYCQRVVASAPPAERAARLVQHFKGADDSRRWLEYIFNGYFGVTQTGGIVLTGLPDEPRSLPHHPEYDPAVADDPNGTANPLERVRSRLSAISYDVGADPAADQRDARSALRAPEESRVPEADKIMRLAYRMYGQLDPDGVSPLDRLEQEAAKLSPEERTVITALRAGWFSAFEVTHVRLDEGIEVRDVLRRRKLWISERSATRQIDLGDLLVGWIMIEGERVTLEGGVCHVPRLFAKPFEDALREVRDWLGQKRRALPWQKRAGLLAIYAVPLLDMLMARMPPSSLVNMAGDALVFSTAHYDIDDPALAAQRLAAQFTQADDGSYCRLVDDTIVAHLDLTGSKLTAECNSRQRLDEIKSMLHDLLGSCAHHRVDSHEDPAAHWKGWGARRADAPAAVLDVPPEVQAQIRQVVLDQMRSWVDKPLPSLGGKTPREAARSQRGREDVALLLTRQQQIFASGANMPPIDLGEIWSTLGIQPTP